MLLRASRIAPWKITVRHAHLQHLFYFMLDVRTASHWRSQGGRQARAPRNWVHKKIPGCAVELNTQNCAWFGSRISLITAMSFREDMPPEPPTRGSVPGPRWGTSVPQTPCAPPSPNPGYATAASHVRPCAPGRSHSPTGLSSTSSCVLHSKVIACLISRIIAKSIGNESVPIQLAQCWFPGLESNFIKQHSETVIV